MQLWFINSLIKQLRISNLLCVLFATNTKHRVKIIDITLLKDIAAMQVVVQKSSFKS